jgi:hypothetical protein
MKKSGHRTCDRRLHLAFLLAAAWLLGSCRTAGDPDLKGGVLAVFAVQEERFAIFSSNPATCEQIIALRDGRSLASIPNGRVRRGQVPYNPPWSWHIDPDDVAMAEVTIELCDGRPSYIEAHLDEWLNTVVRFCPWSARLVSVTDYR